jgi:hypothetical protein
MDMSPQGDRVSQAEEWDDMSEQTRDEISTRLRHVIEDAELAAYRGRLARASRTSTRAFAAMRHTEA